MGGNSILVAIPIARTGGGGYSSVGPTLLALTVVGLARSLWGRPAPSV